MTLPQYLRAAFECGFDYKSAMLERISVIYEMIEIKMNARREAK